MAFNYFQLLYSLEFSSLHLLPFSPFPSFPLLMLSLSDGVLYLLHSVFPFPSPPFSPFDSILPSPLLTLNLTAYRPFLLILSFHYTRFFLLSSSSFSNGPQSLPLLSIPSLLLTSSSSLLSTSFAPSFPPLNCSTDSTPQRQEARGLTPKCIQASPARNVHMLFTSLSLVLRNCKRLDSRLCKLATTTTHEIYTF